LFLAYSDSFALPSNPEKFNPMLEVHPPERTPHTWRDFFIHIATIVVGLVIARRPRAVR